MSTTSARRSEPPESRAYLWWVAAALGAGFFLLPRMFKMNDSALVGKTAIDFSLQEVLNPYGAAPDAPPAIDKTLKLADLKGKVVLLDFWATWCGPCKAETPILDALATRYKDRGVVVVGINTSDAAGNAAPWARQHNLHYPIVYDEGDDTAAAYGVSSLPTLIVLARDGSVLSSRTGLTSSGELERLLEKAL